MTDVEIANLQCDLEVMGSLVDMRDEEIIELRREIERLKHALELKGETPPDLMIRQYPEVNHD